MRTTAVRMLLAAALALFAVTAPLASMQAERKVFRIGDGVTPPRPIKQEQPKYTEKAREAKIEGTVTLTVVIEVDGTTTNIEVVQGLEPELDENAVAAVKQWRFEPATKDGQPVAVAAHIEVNFRLL